MPPTTHPRVRVAIVFGGASSEHGVSCLTAASVVRAIDPSRYEVSGIGITPSGRWTLLPSDQVAALAVADGALPSVSEDLPDAVILRTESGCQIAGLDGDALVDRRGIDVAFALLHGPFGEDGTVQGLFEMMGVRYVGAGVCSSAVGMDKDVMKVVLGAAGLPIGPYVVVSPAEWVAHPDACLARVGALTFPVYVKPARGGSSVGISRVAEPTGLTAAIEEARRWDPKVVIEQGFVNAREIECAVLGGRRGGAPRTSKLGEIRMHTEDGFYDFDAKYLPEEQVSLDVPASVTDELEADVQELARRTFLAIGAEGLGRVDTFVSSDGTVAINEINTMPGFTELSMFPMLWQATGMSYAELIDDLIQQALERPIGLR